MLTQEQDVDVKALYKQGWSISAIARHLDRDRKTIRGYVNGEREPGQRKPAGPDVFAPFERYVRSRLGEDPHLWATTLFDEVVALGYPRAYQSFTREVRQRDLRPDCVACSGVGGRATPHIPPRRIRDPVGLAGVPRPAVGTRRQGEPARGRCRTRAAAEGCSPRVFG